jgi:hypothetical protein
MRPLNLEVVVHNVEQILWMLLVHSTILMLLLLRVLLIHLGKRVLRGHFRSIPVRVCTPLTALQNIFLVGVRR